MSIFIASYNKNITSGSDGYSASIQSEIPEGLTEVQIQESTNKMFELIRNSVVAQIKNTALECQTIALPPVTDKVKIPAAKSKGNFSKNQTLELASESQKDFLQSIASKKGLTIEQCIKDYGYSHISEVTMKDCWSIINKEKD